MFNTLWKKAGRDVWQNKGRTLVILLSITISTMLLGIILVSYSILSREMNASFLNAKPHALSFRMEAFQEDLLQAIADHPDVDVAEARRVVYGRIQRSNGDWAPLNLYVLRDYDEIKLDIVAPEQGAWPPATGAFLVERQAFSVLRGEMDRAYTVDLGNGIGGSLSLTGLTYDVVLPQAEMENIVYGYVTFETLANLGVRPFFNELGVTLSSEAYDVVFARQKANILKTWLDENGYVVTHTSIPMPGKHPHHQIVNGMFIILEIFGVLCCLFCGLLVFNLMTSVLSRHVRQIGIMKAVGARMRQVAATYFGQILGLGLLALLVSLPVAAIAGQYYAAQLAVIMNFNIVDEAVPVWVYAIVIGLGLGTPLLTAAIPILRTSRISIREALIDYGVRQTSFGQGRLERMVLHLPFVSRPMLVGLRNTFRKKGRLALTLCVLSFGAAFFMGALNIDTTTRAFVNDLQQTKAWGVKVNLKDAHEVQRVEEVLRGISGVAQVEPFFRVSGTVVDDEGKSLFSMPLMAMNPASDMLRLTFLEGSWLRPDGNDIIIYQYLADRMPDLKIGGTLSVKIANRTREYRIRGIMNMLGVQQGFISYPAYTSWTGQQGMANGFYLSGVQDGEDYLRALKEEVSKTLKTQDLAVTSVFSAWDGLESLEDHFDLIYGLILALTVMIMLIGGNGMMLSMRTNIIERTREIGVLKAIGASRAILFKMIIGEGLMMGGLSWLLALVWMVPISYGIAYGLGIVMLQSPLPLVLSLWGAVICLPLVLLVTALSCYFPARSTANLSVRATLLYE